MYTQYFSLILTALLLIGCGNDGASQQENNTTENNITLDDDYCTTEFTGNEGQPSNSKGFYGNNVCFGTKRIVGKWKRLLPWSEEEKWEVVEFKSDGNIQYYDINGSLKFATADLQQGYTEYGVNTDGRKLVYYGDIHHYSFEFISIFSDNYPDYFKTTFISTSMEFDSIQVHENHIICKIKYDVNMSCH